MENNLIKDEITQKRKLFANKKLNIAFGVATAVIVLTILGVVIWLAI